MSVKKNNQSCKPTTENLQQLILLKKFAYVEQQGHKLPKELASKLYASKKDSISVNVLGYNGHMQQAIVHAIPIENPSIFAVILEIKSDNPNLPNKVEVLWQGTHDIGSAVADLDPTSPGYTDYMQNRSIILTAVNEAVGRMSQNGKKVSLGVYGHSLGGSLSQVCATDVMDAIAQNHHDRHFLHEKDKDKFVKSSIHIPKEERNYLGEIEHLVVGTFNSAGVSLDTANRADELIRYIHNKKYIGTREQPDITYFAGLNHGDGVQQTGEASILADSTIAKVHLLKTNVEPSTFGKILGGALSFGPDLLVPVVGNMPQDAAEMIKKHVVNSIDVHTAKLFDNEHGLQSRVIDFEIYSNTKKSEQLYITEELNKKASFLQNSALKAIQATIYYFADKIMDTFNSYYYGSKVSAGPESKLLYTNNESFDFVTKSWGDAAWYVFDLGFDALTQNLDLNPPVKHKKNNYKNK